jgi:hypothetical protein
VYSGDDHSAAYTIGDSHAQSANNNRVTDTNNAVQGESVGDSNAQGYSASAADSNANELDSQSTSGAESTGNAYFLSTAEGDAHY